MSPPPRRDRVGLPRALGFALLAALAVGAAGVALALAVQQPARLRSAGPAPAAASAPPVEATAPRASSHRPDAGPAGNPPRGAVPLQGVALAASSPQETPSFVTFGGDPVAGQRVAMGQMGAGIASACFRCHGLQGEGDAGGAFPRLAGQPAFYLYKQLVNYGDGTRPNAVMTPIVLGMSNEERRDVAAYYAQAAGPSRPPPGRIDAQAMQLGATLAAVGSQARGVQSCVSCHGPGGTGLPPDGPALAGQGAHYLELQLQLWSEGLRRNDAYGMMADIARRLTPAERAAVAAYFAAQPAALP